MNNGEKYPERNARIRELRGTKTYAEIAKEVGCSYNAVACVYWRDDHPQYRPNGVKPGRPVPALRLGAAARAAGLTLEDIRAIAAERAAQ